MITSQHDNKRIKFTNYCDPYNYVVLLHRFPVVTKKEGKLGGEKPLQRLL